MLFVLLLLIDMVPYTDLLQRRLQNKCHRGMKPSMTLLLRVLLLLLVLLRVLLLFGLVSMIHVLWKSLMLLLLVVLLLMLLLLLLLLASRFGPWGFGSWSLD
jgi:hypothetical protein